MSPYQKCTWIRTLGLEYLLLGLMATGGIAATVAGSRMLQGQIAAVYFNSTVGMPTGLTLIIIGCVSFGLSAGYLIRDIQSEVWDE